MSIGFMFFGPLGMGWLTIRSLNEPQITRTRAFFLPFIPVILGCVVISLLKIEGMICVVMYLPLAVLLAGVGGLVARAVVVKNKNAILAILLLPFASHWTESHVTFPSQTHFVKNSIEIKGSSLRTWNEIKSVRTITTNELPDSWVHRIGFPRPLDAKISFEGQGGVRLARFERGLVFKETVDEWKPEQLLSFRIYVDPKDIPPEALDEHVTIGGPFFDVLRGTYQIEEHSDGTVTLNLESQFRLSTHFNFYAGIWTDLVMHQIQSDILKVIKLRAEKSAGT